MERPGNTSGFTIIELIVTILILAILAATAYFKWDDIPFKLNSQAMLLASDIRYTQNLSITQNQRFRLVLNSTENSYQIQDESNHPVTISARGSTTNLPAGITFGTITTITNKIIFNTKGIPYDDSPEVPLTQIATISLAAGSKTQIITIYPETGRVTL